MDIRLDPILAAQLGLVTRTQGWAAGATGKQFDRLVASNRLVVVHRGVYRDPATPTSLEQRALAAVLACGAGAVASHRLGLALIGMPRYQSNLVEVTSGGLHRIPGVVTHRSLRPLPHTTVRGVPTTAPARTLIDVGCLVSQALLARWTTTWVSERVVTVTELESEMAAARGHRGVPLLRAVLDDLDRRHEVADSPVEAKLGMLLEDNGFPPLTLHHVVTVSSGAEFELDWSYPQWQIGFEVDGYGVHLRSHESFDHDRFRRNELVIDGWTILNFSGRQVARRSRTVLDQARRALTERSLLP